MKRVDYYSIELKTIPRKNRCSESLRVPRSSPLKLRKEVERFAIYFQREFEYPVLEFAAKEKSPYTASLFSERKGRVSVEACCFRLQERCLLFWQAF